MNLGKLVVSVDQIGSDFCHNVAIAIIGLDKWSVS